MKQILCINVETSPHLLELYDVVSEAINCIITKEHVTPLGHDAIMKKIESGIISLQEMEHDMKIIQSKFFHYYSLDMKETIIQQTKNKIAVFSETA